MKRRWRTAGALGLVASCASTEPSVTIVASDEIVQAAAWFELGAFEGTTCASLDPSLAGGIPFSGAAVRVAFRPNESSPQVGKLKFGSYALGAVARAADCTVIARGCSEAELGDTDNVTIRLEDNKSGGACLAGSSCQAGQCVPVQDNADPALALGCPLRLLGAGPLGIGLKPGTEIVSAPAIVPTERGFLVGYREVETASGQARRVVVPVDIGGGVFQTIAIGLPGRCPGSDEGDGAAMAHGASGSLLAFARKPCGGLQGIDYIAVDAAGNDVKYNFLGDNEVSLNFSAARALANRPGTDNFLLAVLNGNAAVVVPIQKGTSDPASGMAARFSCEESSEAVVAVSNEIVALASVGRGSAPTLDGGVGSEGGVRLVLLNAGDPLDPQWCGGTMPPEPVRMPGAFASVAVSGRKTVVVTNGTSGAAYRLFEGTNPAPTASSDAVRVDGEGRVLFADVAMRSDRFFIVAEKLGAISLISYTTGAMPRREREVLLHADPRVPPLATVRDGRVAVTATADRVAVAWTTAKQLGPDEAVGGYAVFSCAP